jgi:hypothetical protein
MLDTNRLFKLNTRQHHEKQQREKVETRSTVPNLCQRYELEFALGCYCAAPYLLYRSGVYKMQVHRKGDLMWSTLF